MRSQNYSITGTAALASSRASAAQYMDLSAQELLFLLYMASLPHTEVNGIIGDLGAQEIVSNSEKH